jgi:formylmethanofuran dehydrogenase subunit C
MSITLKFIDPGTIPVDVRSLLPEALFDMTTRAIEGLPLPIGNKTISLGEICKVGKKIGRNDQLILEGNTTRLTYIGLGMISGVVMVTGDAGYCTGAMMRGGKIEIQGSVNDGCGLNMEAGIILVHGSAGDFCGAASTGRKFGMSGGEIIIGKNTGCETGAWMRKGLIFVGGNAAEYAGARMTAGTIIINGHASAGAGIGMKRGSLVVGRMKILSTGFYAAGKVDLEWLKIYKTHLIEQPIISQTDWLSDQNHRFTGDHLSVGKGELIIHEIVE